MLTPHLSVPMAHDSAPPRRDFGPIALTEARDAHAAAHARRRPRHQQQQQQQPPRLTQALA